MELNQGNERTPAHIVWELSYSMCLLNRYKNLARNADLTLTLITLVGLATAAGSIPNSNGILASTAGTLLAVTSILQIVYKPAEAKIHAAVSYRMYAQLWSEHRVLSEEEFDRRLIKMHGEDIGVIEGLRLVAELDTAQQLNLDEGDLNKQLTAWNKILRFCS